MCTAITYKTKNFYFGRTLDLEYSYSEEVVIMPKNFPFSLRHTTTDKRRYAIIGTAFVPDTLPLYYDAANEAGLSMAGLNFPENAKYNKVIKSKINIAQFELIPFILGNCSDTDEAVKLISKINITDTSYSSELPLADLHWIIADKNKCVTLECVEDGVKIYDNAAGVLTNNPPFDIQTFNLNNYINLSPEQPENTFSSKLELKNYTKGLGAVGLPGDLSSQSRFVRAVFTKLNSVSGKSEEQSVNQFFHILGSVSQTRGCNRLDGNKYEITVYTSCCNASDGIYYYTTYGNHRINSVDLRKVNLKSDGLYRYPHIDKESINKQN
ncbi:MAG TPA: choloylglycine hydrolase [Clostridiales bacterium]|nr:choloylglycine hydrolase [Clostridiales bacterium]